MHLFACPIVLKLCAFLNFLSLEWSFLERKAFANLNFDNILEHFIIFRLHCGDPTIASSTLHKLEQVHNNHYVRCMMRACTNAIRQRI